MAHVPAHRTLAWILQGLGYAAFCAFIGYFSAAPPYVHLAPDEALLKVSLSHAGQRKEACHDRSAEELARLAPNMRAATVCPRERAPVAIEIELDGKRVYAVVAPPSGLSRDGASNVYYRATMPAGEHTLVARLKDSVDGGFAHVAERKVKVRPGGIVLLDFDPALGWIIRG